MNAVESDHDRIVRFADEFLPADGNKDKYCLAGLPGSVTVRKGSPPDLAIEHCRASIAFSCKKKGSQVNLRWLAEMADNGEKPASMKTVNYRRDVTGSAKTLSTMSDPSLVEVLDVLQQAIDSRD